MNGRIAMWSLGGSVGLTVVAIAALVLAQRSLIYPAPAAHAGVPPGLANVTLETDDALRLRAAYRPAAAGMATIVFFHGNGDNLHGAANATDRLGAAGYGLLLVEYRGYGGNPGKPSEAGLYRDGRAALDWLAGRGTAADRVVLIGNSLGSGVATQLATERPVAALVLVSGFASLADAAATPFPWLPVRLLLFDRYDNRTKLAGIDTPVLVLHGNDDTLILPAQGQQLAHAARRGALVRVRGAGHELAYLPVSQDAIGEWLSRTVPRRD